MDSAAATPSHFHFCTYFDRNYLTRGLVLYDSLVQQCKRPFVLWILCFDEATYSCLASLNSDSIRLISLEEFEEGDNELLEAKGTRSAVEYYWTCTPSLPLFVFRQDPSIKTVTYLDADQRFFADPKPIYDELGEGSILIIEHRYPPELAYLATSSGIYNVGLMVFRRDEHGLRCLTWWRERCIEWCYRRYEDGKFGDQKYLDDWTERFQGVVVLQHVGGCVAPWNLAQYPFNALGSQLTINGVPLILYHFHGFRTISTHVSEPADLVYRIDVEHIASLYRPYAEALGFYDRMLDSGQPGSGQAVTLSERLAIWSGLLSQKYFVNRPLFLSLALWRVGKIWGRDNRIRVHQAVRMSSAGEISAARRTLLAAIVRNPLLLFRLRTLAILAEPAIGSANLKRLRGWYHGGP